MRLYFDTASHLLLGAPGARKPLEKLTLTVSDLADVEIHFYRGFAPEDVEAPVIVMAVKASYDAEEYVGANGAVIEGEVLNCFKTTLSISKADVSELLDGNEEIELILGMRVDGTGYGPWISQPVTIVLSNTVIGDLPDIPAPPSLQALLNEKVDRSGDTMTGPLAFTGGFAPLSFTDGSPGGLADGMFWKQNGRLLYRHNSTIHPVATLLDLGSFVSVDDVQTFDDTQTAKGRTNLGMLGTMQLGGSGETVTLAGTALVPTPAASDDSTKAANTAWVRDFAIPYASGAYIVPEVTNNNATNGANFLAAYTAAAALTPGGFALSATNRACVLLLPGAYNWSALGDFTASAFVDISGISSNRADVQLVGGWAVTSVNYNVSNLTAGANAFGGGAGSTFSGTAMNCSGGSNAFAGGTGSTFSGVATNCAGGTGSFGGGGAFSGTATNCTGANSAFGGGAGSTFSGRATNCSAGFGAFCGGGVFAGAPKLIGCSGAGGSFNGTPGSGVLTLIKDCQNLSGSFSPATADVIIRNCINSDLTEANYPLSYYTETVTAAAANVITHNLGTLDVLVEGYVTSTGQSIDLSVASRTASSITLEFSGAALGLSVKALVRKL